MRLQRWRAWISGLQQRSASCAQNDERAGAASMKKGGEQSEEKADNDAILVEPLPKTQNTGSAPNAGHGAIEKYAEA